MAAQLMPAEDKWNAGAADSSGTAVRAVGSWSATRLRMKFGYFRGTFASVALIAMFTGVGATMEHRSLRHLTEIFYLPDSRRSYLL